MGKRKKEDNTFLRKKQKIENRKKKKTESLLVSFKGKGCDYCTLCSFRICPEKGSIYFALPIVV